jgi:dTDP-glucose 4,6-dehydratase
MEADRSGQMKLLVTGGAGFIGSNFVRMVGNGRLNGFSKVKVLDKLTYAGIKENLVEVSNMPGYEFVHGDINDSTKVRDLLSDVDAVVNFAAESHVDRSISGANDFIQTNIVGVQVLLDGIKSINKEIRFLQVSTDEVYGSIKTGSWEEDWPILPNSPYSASKASGELLARAFYKTHGIDVVITRSSNNYGTHHFPEKLIPLFITNLLEGKKVPLYGTGENVRDWLHVDDHCRGIYKVLMNGKSGEVYNIGGGRELTNNEITSIILESMGASASNINYVEDRPGHDFRYSVNWKKIYDELGHEPQVKFEDGLKETIQWYKENESWWKPLKNNQ